LGACYDEEKIAQYLSAADLCISPGNVGLTAIHSLGYGTPVATHDDLSNQMPEAEAITDGYNGFLFQKDNGKDLQQNIEQWFEQDMDEDELRERCFEIIDMYYNPEYQLSVFERALGNNKPVNIG
jgi:glycosyltransferase involved in cell wall biosynthesis